MSETAPFYVYTCRQCGGREVLPRAEALTAEGEALELRCYDHEQAAPAMEGPEHIALPLPHARAYQRLRRARQAALQACASFEEALQAVADGGEDVQSLAGEARREAQSAAETAGGVSAQTFSPVKVRRTPVE